MHKKFVSVTVEFTKDGKVIPEIIKWDDNDGQRIFEIDKIIDIRKAASLKAGGIGFRYTCRICGQQAYLYRDEDTWYVEAKN